MKRGEVEAIRGLVGRNVDYVSMKCEEVAASRGDVGRNVDYVSAKHGEQGGEQRRRGKERRLCECETKKIKKKWRKISGKNEVLYYFFLKKNFYFVSGQTDFCFFWGKFLTSVIERDCGRREKERSLCDVEMWRSGSKQRRRRKERSLCDVKMWKSGSEQKRREKERPLCECKRWTSGSEQKRRGKKRPLCECEC